LTANWGFVLFFILCLIERALTFESVKVVIHTGRGGSFPRVESETTPHTAQPKRRHNVAAAIAIMTKSGPMNQSVKKQ
jgi:hypothetical protein